MTRRPPRYPDILKQAGIEGRVHVRYVVDTMGRVMRSSLEVLSSTHDLFTQSLRLAISNYRFATPRRRGAAVRLRVEEVTTFIWPTIDSYHLRPTAPITLAVDTAGKLETIFAPYIPFAWAPGPGLTTDDETAIYSALMEEFMRLHGGPPMPSAYCLLVAGKPPNAELLDRLARIGRRVVPLSACPPTYASMFVIEGDNRGAPKGWVDPVRLEAGPLLGWAANMVVLEASVARGTGKQFYLCDVLRESTQWTRVICASTGAIAH